MRHLRSVELDTHLVLAHGDEVVEVNAAVAELRTGMLRDQLGDQGRSNGQLCDLCQHKKVMDMNEIRTMVGEVKELGKRLAGGTSFARVREADTLLTKLVEEGVSKGVDGGETLGWGVLQKKGDQVNEVIASLAEHLGKYQYLISSEGRGRLLTPTLPNGCGLI